MDKRRPTPRPSAVPVGCLALVLLLGIGCTNDSTPSSPSAIRAPAVAALVIHGIEAAKEVGQIVQLTASVTLSDGLEKNLTASQVTWQSSDIQIAQVSATALLTILRPGEIDVSATFQSVSASAHLVAFPLPPPPRASLTVTPGIPGSAWAWTGLDVSLDATASTGDRLTYLIDFGDGQSAPMAATRHAMSRPGHFPIRATVTDRLGRTDTTTRVLDVQGFTAQQDDEFWFNRLENNPLNNQFEYRSLSFLSQEGRTLRGQYVHPEGPCQTPKCIVRSTLFTGTLSGEREIRIVLDDGSIELAGVISFEPVGNTSGSPYYNARLAVRGGTANGLTLLFWHHPSS